MVLANRLSLFIALTFLSWKNDLKGMVEERKVQYDGWFVVLLAVLLTLAFSIASGLAVWCVVHQGGSFTGDWQWEKWGVSVKAECAT
ncbi:hypothetical protein ACKXGF_14045 [Alkalibacillus sp. S2W]|uniref:hypothetical protein n=1 Tax=Alkalibacillus sp. S2W TaxID=3386553 RepID=UPI00398CB100